MRISMLRTTTILLFLCSCFPWAGAQAGPQPPSQGPTVTIPSTGFAGLISIALRASRSSPMITASSRAIAMPTPLKPPAPDENRVVFFGDSITDIWKLEESFSR